jgi:bacteriophage N4 adsorption protein B
MNRRRQFSDGGALTLETVIGWLIFFQQELLVFCAAGFLVGAVDDLAVDLIWIVRKTYRYFTWYRKHPAQRVEELAPPKHPGMIAIFIPTWMEANVIGKMIEHCLNAWQHSATTYKIYVGCYPNDPAGIDAIISASTGHKNIRLIICTQNGPTTKADCLNHLWLALLREELELGMKAKAIVLHDAEDRVDPLELAIFDRLIEKAQAVQLPVIPVTVPGSPWISGHYCDEFVEAHAKTLVVRECIGAAIPLAGVGCAIDRNIIGRMALTENNRPFDIGSLTEDYELGIKIGRMGGRSMIARLVNEQGAMVGTRACFPSSISTAVRQKTRWMVGIALAGWDRLGWHGSWADLWMQMRDRRVILAAIIVATSYFAALLTFAVMALQHLNDTQIIPLSPMLQNMLLLCAFALFWRVVFRFGFVTFAYGWRDGLLSIPRMLTGNIISILSAKRACVQYMAICLGRRVTWDKTEHSHFPEAS